jgi:hypothetical protein
MRLAHPARSTDGRDSGNQTPDYIESRDRRTKGALNQMVGQRLAAVAGELYRTAGFPEML